MYLPRVYDSTAHAHRVRYAIVNILRDRVVNEGAFNKCFEMEDGDQAICAILRRGRLAASFGHLPKPLTGRRARVCSRRRLCVGQYLILPDGSFARNVAAHSGSAADIR